MKNVCIVMALVMLIAAPLTLLAEEDGAAIFKTKCANCHGPNAEGKTMGTLKMPAVKGTKMTADQMVSYITKGQAGNKIHANPVSGVSEEQAKAVADFSKTLK